MESLGIVSEEKLRGLEGDEIKNIFLSLLTGITRRDYRKSVRKGEKEV